VQRYEGLEINNDNTVDWKLSETQSQSVKSKIYGWEWNELAGLNTAVLKGVLDGAAVPSALFTKIVPLLGGECIVVGPEWYNKLHKEKYRKSKIVTKAQLRIQDAMTNLFLDSGKEGNYDKTHLIICKVHYNYSLCIVNMKEGILTVKDMQSRYNRQDVVYHSIRIFMEAVMRKFDRVVHRWHGIQQEDYSTQPYHLDHYANTSLSKNQTIGSG
jgi:hypothetical protein